MGHKKRLGKQSGTSPSHFVYILTCSDGSLYTGYTTDPVRRLREHNRGVASKFTRGRRPVRLTFLERAASVGAALRREHEVKALSKKKKILLSEGLWEKSASSSR